MTREADDETHARTQFLRGTLELLVLQAVAEEARHGYGVLEWLEAQLGPDLPIEEGTLYPALHRMEDRGWLQSEWGVSENRRRAKYYRLAAAGRARLGRESERWQGYAKSVLSALGGADG